jgi:hypothetical protein
VRPQLFKRAQALPPLPSTDEVVKQIDEELAVVKGLTRILADRAREAEELADQE